MWELNRQQRIRNASLGTTTNPDLIFKFTYHRMRSDGKYMDNRRVHLLRKRINGVKDKFGNMVGTDKSSSKKKATDDVFFCSNNNFKSNTTTTTQIPVYAFGEWELIKDPKNWEELASHRPGHRTHAMPFCPVPYIKQWRLKHL